MRMLMLFVTFVISQLALAETVAITGAHIHTMTTAGSVLNGTIVLRDGNIVEIGANVTIPANARIIEAAGQVITPGLVHVPSRLGIQEVSLEATTVDHMQTAATPFGASFEVARAFNPTSTLIGLARSEGVTHAMLAPSSSVVEDAVTVFSGTGIAVELSGDPDATMRGTEAIYATLGAAGGARAAGSRAQALQVLEQAFVDALDFQTHRAAFESGARRTYSVSMADLEALQGVINEKDEVPIVIRVDRASDIRQVVDLASTYGLYPIIWGGAEAWQVATELLPDDATVIVDALSNLPNNFDSLSANLNNAAKLVDAGVPVIIGEANSHNAGNLRQNAGNAVANGLAWIDGLAAITREPARAFGMPSNVGRLIQGAPVNMVLWDGDPLDVSSFAVRVWIDGEEIDRTNRQSLLRDRYHPDNSSRDLPPAYR